MARAAQRRPRVCFVRQYYYPQDPRFRVQVQAAADAGFDVDVICLRKQGERRRERSANIRVLRLPDLPRPGGKLGYLFEYLSFLVLATIALTGLHARRRFQLVQVCSLPDVLVFAAIIPRFTSARVLLDLRETMPEFVATKFGVSMRHPLVRVTALLEQVSIRFAHIATTCTQQMKDAFVQRGADPWRIGVILNSADESVFNPAQFPAPAPRAERLTLVCHGTIEERYGHDTVVRAIALLQDELPGLRFQIFGDGPFRMELEELVATLDVQDRVSFSNGYVPIDELLQAIASADAGVVAMRRDVFRDLTHCLKMYDFVAMRKPVLCSRTASVEAYFDDDCFEYFVSGDEYDLARAIRALHADPLRRARLVERATVVSEPYRWEHQCRRYQQILSETLKGNRPDTRVLSGSAPRQRPVRPQSEIGSAMHAHD
jgi:glycosyltransferase involved in cell wall biosynthesis